MFESYQSPFSWRYGSTEMRGIWSERGRRLLWRRLWVWLAETEAEFGLVSAAQVEDLRRSAREVDIERSLELERSLRHDLMAELKVFAAQSPAGGAVLHLGATSMDIKDNAEVLQIASSLDLLAERLAGLLEKMAERVDSWADTPVIGYTHIQPAEPTTLGYRFAFYAQDLLGDLHALRRLRHSLRAKGLRGAVGTSASFAALLGSEQLPAFQEAFQRRMGLPAFDVVSQTYPRRQDYDVLAALAGMAASIYKFAGDLRLLQAQPFGELNEPFGEQQVGSSAMPFKRNPVKAEQICSLARAVSQAPAVAWQNAALSLLERTLDDSANRRSLLPEAFLATDEILKISTDILDGLALHPAAMRRNLETYAPFAATEPLLMALVHAGADRQEMHEVLRRHSLAAWKALEAGELNPLVERVCAEPAFLQHLPARSLRLCMESGAGVGDAPLRSRRLAAAIRRCLSAAPESPDGGA